jgi:predicted cupin superfamily sugar epimerase
VIVEEAVARLGLEAHPEGGFYRRTYRSPLVACDVVPGFEWSDFELRAD